MQGQKGFKRFFEKKLKIEPIKSLAFNKANKKKGKAAIIMEIKKKNLIIIKPRPK